MSSIHVFTWTILNTGNLLSTLIGFPWGPSLSPLIMLQWEEGFFRTVEVVTGLGYHSVSRCLGQPPQVCPDLVSLSSLHLTETSICTFYRPYYGYLQPKCRERPHTQTLYFLRSKSSWRKRLSNVSPSIVIWHATGQFLTWSETNMSTRPRFLSTVNTTTKEIKRPIHRCCPISLMIYIYKRRTSLIGVIYQLPFLTTWKDWPRRDTSQR